MPYKKGDAVIYIYNTAFDSNRDLLKRPEGVVDEVWNHRGYGDMVGCNWIKSNGSTFFWNVPITHVKLSKENK
jgi:hypothetical protein